MGNSDDDILVRSFMKANRRETEDNGFTEAVMRKLPRSKESSLKGIYIRNAMAAVISAILFFSFGGLRIIGEKLMTMTGEVLESLAVYGVGDHQFYIYPCILFATLCITWKVARSM